MKKIWSILAIAASMMLAFQSCVMEESPGIGGDNEGEEILPDPDEPSDELLPDEQKVKLENVAVEMMNKCQADDFRRYFELADRFMSVYVDNDDYDMSAITDAADESVDKILQESYQEIYDAVTNKYISESIENYIIALSQHTGEFYFEEKGVVRGGSSSDMLKVSVPLDGHMYVAELEQSGDRVKAIYNYSDVYEFSTSGYWDNEKGQYIELPDGAIELSTWMANFNIEVPERVDVKLYEDGTAIADIVIELSYSLTSEGLDPSVDNFNAKTTVTLDNGYSIVSRKIKYDGLLERAGVSISFMKDGISLVTAVADCDAKLRNTEHTYDDSDDYYIDRGKYTAVEVVRADSVRFDVDVLGQVQIRGNCPDGVRFGKAWNEWDDEVYDVWYSKNTVNLDSAMEKINSCIDLGVYYDMKSDRQAEIEFEWEVYGELGTSGGIESYPVIVFDDGSRYAWDDYFTEEAFRYMFDTYESFVEDYSDLLGIVIESEEPEMNMPDSLQRASLVR